MLPSDVLKYIVGKNNTNTNAATGTGASQAGLADSGTNQWYNQAGLNKNAQDAANPSLSFNFGAGKEFDSGQSPDKPGGMTNNYADATPDTRQTPAPQNVQPRSPAYPSGLTSPAGQSATTQFGQPATTQSGIGDYYSQFGIAPGDPSNQPVTDGLPNMSPTGPGVRAWLPKEYQQPLISQPPTLSAGQSATAQSGQTTAPQYSSGDNYPFGVPYPDSKFGATVGDPSQSVAGSLLNIPLTDPEFVGWLSKQRQQSSISQPSTDAAIGNGNASGDAPGGQTPQTNPGINDPKTMEAMNNYGIKSASDASQGTDKAKASPPPPESAEIKERFGAIVPESPNLRTDNDYYENKGKWTGYQNAWHSISIHTMQQVLSDKSKREKIYDAGWVGFVSAKYESYNNATTINSSGHAYGTFQLTDGLLNKFKDTYYKEKFDHLKVGTPAFDEKWVKLAKTDPNFVKLEYEYIKKEAYEKFANKILATYGLDVNKSSRAVQEAIFSTIVRKSPGEALDLVKNALAGKNFNNMTDKDFVTYIQDYKYKDASKGEQHRVKSEKADLLDLCDGGRLNIHPAPTPTPKKR